MFFLVPIAGLVIGGNPADSRLPVWLAIPVIAIATYICYAITTHRLAFLPKSKWFMAADGGWTGEYMPQQPSHC